MAKAERYISDRFCATRWCSVNRHSDRSGSELVGKRTGAQPPTIPPTALASYPGQFALSELPEEAWNQVRVFPTCLTGEVTSEIAEDYWERGWLWHDIRCVCTTCSSSVPLQFTLCRMG